jgi:hypothetical protein
MGFLMPGVIFWLMGGGPLLVAGWAALGSFRYHRRADALEARGRGAGSSGGGAASGLGSAAPTASAPSPSAGSGASTLPPSRSAVEARAAIARAMGAAVTRAVRAPAAPAEPLVAAPAAPAAPDPPDVEVSLVEGLERLAELRRRGDLSLMEYDAAKRALIKEHEARS